MSNLKPPHKPTTIKSKKIRDSARGEDCTLRIPDICNGNPETTVFAHINTSMKGMGNKSPDLFGVYACSDCHAWMDGRAETDTYRKHKEAEILRAYIETLMKLYEKEIIHIN